MNVHYFEKCDNDPQNSNYCLLLSNGGKPKKTDAFVAHISKGFLSIRIINIESKTLRTT